MESPCSTRCRWRVERSSARPTPTDGGSRRRLASTSLAEPLVELVRRAGANSREVFAFLTKHLPAGNNGDSVEARAHRAFARAFITAAAERDGFIELVAAPDTGGLFAQGWSMSLPTGVTILADASDDLALRDVEVAHFEREDILPPAHGICFFGKSWREDSLATVDAIFFEEGGRLLRLDVVPNSLLLRGDRCDGARCSDASAPRGSRKKPWAPLSASAGRGSAASTHFRRRRLRSLPRWMRSCRLPTARFWPSGGCSILFAGSSGYLLKSTANLYAHLDLGWCALPRPDLGQGFAHDGRFANLLDARDEMHGFIAHAPPAANTWKVQHSYLELVLKDGSCLFQPIA